MQPIFIEKINELMTKAIEGLFFKTYIDSKTFVSESVPSFKASFLVQIGLRAKEQECMIILGISRDTAKDLLSELMDLATKEQDILEITKSALGELANTMACEFAMFEKLIDVCGKLHPTTPLVWVVDKDLPDFIDGHGMSSQIKSGSFQIYTHLVFYPPNHDKTDHSHWNPTKSLSIYDPSSR